MRAFEIADLLRTVEPGSIVHVPAGVEHRFHGIVTDLQVLVFWAPPRRSRRTGT